MLSVLRIVNGDTDSVDIPKRPMQRTTEKKERLLNDSLFTEVFNHASRL